MKNKICDWPDLNTRAGCHFLELGNDENHQYRNQPDGDGREQQQDGHHVVHRGADGVGRNAQDFAAGGQNFFEVLKLFAGAEHGVDLWRQKRRHFFERLAEPRATFEVRREHVKPHAHHAVAAGGGGKDGLLNRLSAIQRRLQQVEKEPCAVAALHRQREQKMQQHGERDAWQQDQHRIPKQADQKC